MHHCVQDKLLWAGPEADGETRGVQLILALPSSAFHSLLPKSIGIAGQSSVNT